MKMITLKQTIQDKKLQKFLKQRSDEPKGNITVFNRIVKAIVKNSKAVSN